MKNQTRVSRSGLLYTIPARSSGRGGTKGSDRKPWEEATRGVDPTQFKLRDAIKPIAIAAHQVMEAGTPEQQEAAVAVLAEARRKLYAILAEGD